MTPSENVLAAFDVIALDRLIDSPLNRKVFNPQKFDDLVASVKRGGVWNPLLVRSHPLKGKGSAALFEILAGHRRARAAKEAGLTEVPVRIVELDDDAALELMILDNLQREDVHPLEEAQGYLELLKRPGYDVPAIALKVGKDESYVYKRLKFADLIEPAREAFLKDEINARHALILARLPANAQEDAMKEIFQEFREYNRHTDKEVKIPVVISPSQLQAWVQTEVYMDLGKVAFSKSDEKLLPKAGSCLNCTKHTAAQMELLDSGAKGDHCLDAACFHQKQNAHVVQIQKAAKDSGRKLLTIAERGGTKADLQEYDTHIITKSTDHCDSKEEAVWVDGPLIGKTNFICRDKACKTHKTRGVYGQAAEAKTFAEIWADKKKRLEEKINGEVQAETWRLIIAAVHQDFTRDDMMTVGERLIERAGHDCQRLLCAALKLEPKKEKQYGSVRTDFDGALMGHLLDLSDPDLPGFLVGLCLLSYNSFNEDNLEYQAKRHKIDTKALGELLAGPMLADFEKKKAKAKVAHDKKKVEQKKAAKAAAPKGGKKAKAAKPVKDVKRAAANDVDLDEDPEGEE